MRLFLALFLISSICLIQVSKGNHCIRKWKCNKYGGQCKANCDDGKWEVPNGCKGGQHCKCCTSTCIPEYKCTRVAGFCVTGGAADCPNGRLTNGCIGTGCQCCVEPKDVKASFKLTNKEYSEELRNHSSNAFKNLKTEVEDSVLPALTAVLGEKVTDFSVEFFRNGSVVVHSKVSTEYENQKVADKEILNALKNSGVTGLDPSSVSVGVRICVPAQDNRNVAEACAEMKEDRFLPITCVEARDRYECLQRLEDEEVDVVRADSEDVYLAKELYPDGISVIANTRDQDKVNEGFRYKAVAVVRRSTIQGLWSLEGRKSCHTGYGKTTGWHVPFARLTSMNNKINLTCPGSASVVENNLRSVSSYFGEACIPGKWVPDDETDTRLKDTYTNLCSLCDNPSECSKEDAYAGYEGALQCLIDSGDVAWTSFDAAKEFFQSRSDVSDFGFLCRNGQIDNLDDATPCFWAARPWPAWLTRANEEDKAAIFSVLQGAIADVDPDTDSWAKDVLGVSKKSTIKYVNPMSPNEYINKGGYKSTLTKVGCEGTPVRLCADSQVVMKKCRELAAVLKSRRVRPALNCVESADCVTAIANGVADIVSLDGGDMFKGYREHKIIPVISEVYGEVDASYFAVAAVWADSGITSLAELKGKKSCHTGIGKTAGWKIPTVTLLEAGLLNEAECDWPGQVGKFFSESCAPGAKLSKYDPLGTNPESLCNLCVGNGEPNATNKCNRDDSENYYSYTGAFRCLAEGGGDVAFIKHTTIPSNTDDNSVDGTWTQYLKSSEFRLLCKDNVTREVSDYVNCHLARVPSHKVVTRNGTNDVLQEEIRILLLRASETLPLGQDVFTLFGDYGADHDIIFKSSATSLANLREDDFHKLLDSTYGTAVLKLDSCT